MDRQTEGRRRSKAYRVSKALRLARRRLLAKAEGGINGILDTCELELWYDTDARVKYTYCWRGTAMHYGVEPVYLN